MECMWCVGPDNNCHTYCKCVCHAIAEGLYPDYGLDYESEGEEDG